jgi:hypothetical protein
LYVSIKKARNQQEGYYPPFFVWATFFLVYHGKKQIIERDTTHRTPYRCGYWRIRLKKSTSRCMVGWFVAKVFRLATVDPTTTFPSMNTKGKPVSCLLSTKIVTVHGGGDKNI